MTPAILPHELTDLEPRTVNDMATGETGYVVFTALIVFPDRTCFLSLGAELRRRRNIDTIRVFRSEDGFRVTVPHGIAYRPGFMTGAGSGALGPVASVEIVPEFRCGEDL